MVRKGAIRSGRPRNWARILAPPAARLSPIAVGTEALYAWKTLRGGGHGGGVVAGAGFGRRIVLRSAQARNEGRRGVLRHAVLRGQGRQGRAQGSRSAA